WPRGMALRVLARSARLADAPRSEGSVTPGAGLAFRLEHAPAKRLAVTHELTASRPDVLHLERVVQDDHVRVAADGDRAFAVREAQRSRRVRGDEAERIGERQSFFVDEIRHRSR